MYGVVQSMPVNLVLHVWCSAEHACMYIQGYMYGVAHIMTVHLVLMQGVVHSMLVHLVLHGVVHSFYFILFFSQGILTVRGVQQNKHL